MRNRMDYLQKSESKMESKITKMTSIMDMRD